MWVDRCTHKGWEFNDDLKPYTWYVNLVSRQGYSQRMRGQWRPKTLYLIYEACENESDLHEHEVRGRVEVGEGVERKVVVDTVERGWNKIKEEDVKVLRYNPNNGVYTVPRNTNLKYMYTRLGTQLLYINQNIPSFFRVNGSV